MMQLMLRNFLFFLMMLVLVLPSHAAHATSRTKHKHKSQPHALVDRTASYSDIVIDAESGRILHEQDADSLRHPASLTKMMTLYLTFQAIENDRLSINQYLPVSVNASEQSPSKIGLRPGQRIRVEDAILSIVTESANDSAMVLAEWLGGNEQNFGTMMTREAKALGMTHSYFVNPTGLPDPDQITTARDIAILGHSLVYHFPQFYTYFSRESFIYAGNYYHNHNHLMDRYEGMDGIKTGYIRASGFNLAASAVRGKTRLIGVVFGGRSATARDNRMALLLDQCFSELIQEKARDERIASTASAPATTQPPQAANQTPSAEGDSTDSAANDDSNYVTLPNKLASNFPPKPVTPSRKNKMTDVGTGNWGIQIGAFATSEAGEDALSELAQSLPQLLGSAVPVVERVTDKKLTLYRARLMEIDPKTAQAVCAYLLQNGRTCLTVGP